MRPARLTLAALAAGVALVTAACGSDTTNDAAPESGSGSGSSRTVDVEMVDVAFEPAEVTVAEGETVTLRFTNTGEVTHDAFIGDTDAQDDHEMDMADTHGEHGASDNDNSAITIEPGDEAELTYTFDEAGRFEVGCHQPGHYKAGMKIDVTVE